MSAKRVELEIGNGRVSVFGASGTLVITDDAPPGKVVVEYDDKVTPLADTLPEPSGRVTVRYPDEDVFSGLAVVAGEGFVEVTEDGITASASGYSFSAVSVLGDVVVGDGVTKVGGQTISADTQQPPYVVAMQVPPGTQIDYVGSKGCSVTRTAGGRVTTARLVGTNKAGTTTV